MDDVKKGNLLVMILFILCFLQYLFAKELETTEVEVTTMDIHNVRVALYQGENLSNRLNEGTFAL